MDEITDEEMQKEIEKGLTGKLEAGKKILVKGEGTIETKTGKIKMTGGAQIKMSGGEIKQKQKNKEEDEVHRT